MTLHCTPLKPEHLSDVYRIERHAHTHPWSENLIRDINSRGGCHHVLFDGEQLVGYYYAQNIVGELTLLNIAVDPSLQGKGYGKALLEHLVDLAHERSAESIWLEVRASNQRAFGLYEALGFNEVDRRLNYYPTDNGKEDAIIMSYILF
tara:strand:- start:2742 stop:3188 length:447 start_codon:yes stop_codon:yes gene_type:complete